MSHDTVLLGCNHPHYYPHWRRTMTCTEVAAQLMEHPRAAGLLLTFATDAGNTELLLGEVQTATGGTALRITWASSLRDIGKWCWQVEVRGVFVLADDLPTALAATLLHLWTETVT